jgi:hypothetical protein
MRPRSWVAGAGFRGAAASVTVKSMNGTSNSVRRLACVVVGCGLLACGPQVDDPSTSDGADGATAADTGDGATTNTMPTTGAMPMTTVATTMPPSATSDDDGPGMTTAFGDDSSGSAGPATDTGTCVPQTFHCEEGCGALYDCGVEDGNCMFTGDPAERMGFVANCAQNPLCDTLASLIDDCACAQTVATLMGASADFTDICQNGIPPA